MIQASGGETHCTPPPAAGPLLANVFRRTPMQRKAVPGGLKAGLRTSTERPAGMGWTAARASWARSIDAARAMWRRKARQRAAPGFAEGGRGSAVGGRHWQAAVPRRAAVCSESRHPTPGSTTCIGVSALRLVLLLGPRRVIGLPMDAPLADVFSCFYFYWAGNYRGPKFIGEVFQCIGRVFSPRRRDPHPAAVG